VKIQVIWDGDEATLIEEARRIDAERRKGDAEARVRNADARERGTSEVTAAVHAA